MTFQADYPVVHHWIVTNHATNDFARNLLTRLHKRGALSPGQMAWVEGRVRRETASQRAMQGSPGWPRGRSASADAIIAMTMPVEPP